LGDPTGSNATAGLTLRVTGTHKPFYHGKVKIPTPLQLKIKISNFIILTLTVKGGLHLNVFFSVMIM
jgi:hypothetical protein